jgi:iron complex outermembrane recepter protein
MTGSHARKAVLASGTALAAMFLAATPAFAQAAPADKPEAQDTIVVTGSRIKQDPNDSALPLQIISPRELQRNSISSTEQLVGFLTSNGSGGDNLASNSDVVSGAQRGNNGASFANLRGQGSAGTLVLLNGRRVAAHGLNGAGVDVNQIPFAAIERVEVLKDGASAIYGTDAIGGVINFITRKDYEGVGLTAFTDITQEGDSPIYRASAIAGYGKLDEQGFNIMASVSYSQNGLLRGSDRKFVNTFQPDRGLSVDTRGTPFATILPLGVGANTPAGTIIRSAGTAPFVIGSTTVRASGGINVLDLPGGPGCGVNDGQQPYDTALWAFPQAEYACAWDTGRAAALQQPLKTLTWFGRAVAKLGDHQIAFELTGSDATAAKTFSNLQLTPNTSTRNYAYFRNTTNAANYDAVFNRLAAAFPSLEPQRGLPISYRWRCIECGPREITTNTTTARYALNAEGPLFADWNYQVGASQATSQSRSKLGSGYYYTGTTAAGANDPNAPTAPGALTPGIVGVLNASILNPFLFPGQTQSAQGLAQLAAVSAKGVTLYGGKFTVTQADASVSGGLFDLPGGRVKVALGVDYRVEKYKFNGDTRAATNAPLILAAPFDDGNALNGVSRTVKAAYAEALVPVFKGFELSLAGRIDDYTGFGSTFNPKFAAKFRPAPWLLFRGSYSTGFRVPTFNQVFNPRTAAQYTGRDIADPKTCPGGVPNSTAPGCIAIQPDIINGGRPNLKPEKAKQASLGAVFQPSRHFSASVDWWMINRSDAIRTPELRDLINNFPLFTDNFIRDASGNLVAIDQSLVNSGGTVTQGLDITLRGDFDALGGQIAAGIDGTYLLRKRERLLSNAPLGPSLIGAFTFSDDLGLRWKHNAFISYTRDEFTVALTQLFRSGYTNQKLPGVADGSVNPPNDVDRVSDYITYNLSLAVAVTPKMRLTAGVKNIFNTDPPFAVTYDSNTGAGSSWEPRVADPRGRAFTMQVEVKF